MGFRGDVSQSRYSDRNRHTAVVRKTGEGRLCGGGGGQEVCAKPLLHSAQYRCKPKPALKVENLF